ncbi:hypothetical protein K0M31_004471 [Melipona bicolor]|uniref:Uncharacterized protein n=1 Tax=Melipona bicolor TaxID=60889 RepID=A0AA40FXH6_9HYME|nr:hypothetical protein K0M31_004471 [Melipona bicolor]
MGSGKAGLLRHGCEHVDRLANTSGPPERLDTLVSIWWWFPWSGLREIPAGSFEELYLISASSCDVCVFHRRQQNSMIRCDDLSDDHVTVLRQVLAPRDLDPGLDDFRLLTCSA